MRCPLCQRDIGRTAVDEITHRPIGPKGSEPQFLCGYTSKSFLQLDALPSTILSATIRRLWRTLDYHMAHHDEPVEAEGPGGWMDVADIIEEALREEA